MMNRRWSRALLPAICVVGILAWWCVASKPSTPSLSTNQGVVSSNGVGPLDALDPMDAKAARQEARAAWMAKIALDDNGRIPHNPAVLAKNEMNSLRAVTSNTPATLGGLDQLGWTEMGPTRFGGRVRAIAVDPNNVSRVWIGGVDGGIWRSDNRGGSWTRIDDFQANLAITSIVIDPTDSQNMWAATGEGLPADLAHASTSLKVGACFDQSTVEPRGRRCRKLLAGTTSTG